MLAHRLVTARLARVGPDIHRLRLLAALITPPYQVGQFVLGRALGLIIVTAALGYGLGGLVGVIWNRVGAARAA
jgi:hypothetical protein